MSFWETFDILVFGQVVVVSKQSALGGVALTFSRGIGQAANTHNRL